MSERNWCQSATDMLAQLRSERNWGLRATEVWAQLRSERNWGLSARAIAYSDVFTPPAATATEHEVWRHYLQ